jgi:hypothetical protein
LIAREKREDHIAWSVEQNKQSKMADASGSESGQLLRYIVLAKNTKGRGAVGVIQQALQAPNTFVFGELLDVANIKAVRLFNLPHHQFFILPVLSSPQLIFAINSRVPSPPPSQIWHCIRSSLLHLSAASVRSNQWARRCAAVGRGRVQGVV